MVSLFGLLLVRPENKESKGFFRESYHCLINSLNEREDFMMNEAIVEKVKALIAAPSCYAGLKKIAEEYIAALGSDQEKEAGRKLVAELEADVLSIDDVLAFFESDAGEKTFGVKQAAAYAAHAREVKAKGGKWCDCPACAPGREILDRKEELC
jgi:hypothetical protein